MEKAVIGCSGARHIAKSIAKKINAEYSELGIEKFPDGEMDIRFLKNVGGKRVLLIQSFYGNISEKIIETLFAGYTARDLGVKKVELAALYFPYFRKDKRFKPGECISIKVMNEMFKVFDRINVVEPHLHRVKKIKKILKNGKRIAVAKILAEHLKKIKEPVFIGPDIESMQWAKSVADLLKRDFFILRKIRYGSRKVKIKINKKIKVNGKNVVIIDDIISSGHTLLETVKEIKKFKPKKIYCVGIHGLFADNSLTKLKKDCVVLSTNTIPSKASKIDVSEAVANFIK